MSARSRRDTEAPATRRTPVSSAVWRGLLRAAIARGQDDRAAYYRRRMRVAAAREGDRKSRSWASAVARRAAGRGSK